MYGAEVACIAAAIETWKFWQKPQVQLRAEVACIAAAIETLFYSLTVYTLTNVLKWLVSRLRLKLN